MRHVNEVYKKKRELVDLRRPVGLNVIASIRGPIIAYQLYDVVFSDGSSEVARGENLRTYHGTQDLNGTAAQIKRAGKTLHPQLEPALRAAHTLLERVSNVCWDIDLPRAPLRNRTRASSVRKRRSATKPEGRKK